MGTLLVIDHDQQREFVLTPSVRVGRHWSNDLVLGSEAVPLSWLELRWRGGSWCWRVLSAQNRTRGSGAAGDEGWRIWRGTTGHVRLDASPNPVELRLVHDAPPQLLVERLTRPGRFGGADAERFVELWPDGRVWPLGVEPTESPPLHDGQVFLRGEDAFRLHLPRTVPDTAPVGLDMRDPRLELVLDLPRLLASFSVGQQEVVAAGECVRVLAVYALARVGDADEGGGGWVPAQAAHDDWIALGGRAKSPVDRLAWERGKLRTQLARQGASGLDGLFDLRRASGHAEVRLAMAPERIDVVDQAE